jgi:hypothetical protein
MSEPTRKPMLTPREALMDKARRDAREQRTPKPLVGGSIPSGPANLTPWGEAGETLLLRKRVGGRGTSRLAPHITPEVLSDVLQLRM